MSIINGGHWMGKEIRGKLGLKKKPETLLISTDRDGLKQTVACIYNHPNTLLCPKGRQEEGSQDPCCLGLEKGSFCNAIAEHPPEVKNFHGVTATVTHRRSTLVAHP